MISYIKEHLIYVYHYKNVTLKLILGIVFNDGPSWKEHRNFVTHEFRKFGFGNQSIEQRIQIVVDEYLHEISVSQQQFQIMDR